MPTSEEKQDVIFCRKCGEAQIQLSDKAERIQRTNELLIDYCVRHSLAISCDGRVSEMDAARLLSLQPAGLKNLRRQGVGPSWLRRGIGGCKLSYLIGDLAAWLEAGRVEITNTHSRR